MFVTEENKPWLVDLARRSPILADLTVMAGNLCQREEDLRKMKHQALDSLHREVGNYTRARDQKIIAGVLSDPQILGEVVEAEVDVALGNLVNDTMHLRFGYAGLDAAQFKRYQLRSISESLSSTMASLDAVAQMYRYALFVRNPETGKWEDFHPRCFNCTEAVQAVLRLSAIVTINDPASVALVTATSPTPVTVQLGDHAR